MIIFSWSYFSYCLVQKIIFCSRDLGTFIQYISKIFQKTNISYPLIRTRMYMCVSGGTKCQFFGKFCVRTKRIISIQKCFRESVSFNFFEISITNSRDVVTFRLVSDLNFATLLRNKSFKIFKFFTKAARLMSKLKYLTLNTSNFF